MVADDGDPHPYVVVLVAVAGAWLATWLQRYVTIVGTAFGGAWAMLVGVLARDRRQGQAGGGRGRRRVGAVSDATGAGPGVGSVGVGALGLIGVAMQLYVTGGNGGRVLKARKKA